MENIKTYKHKVNIYKEYCPVTMGKKTSMFLETFKNMCDWHCKKGKWINSKHSTPYDEKCKICDGLQIPSELIILTKNDESEKMENNELVEPPVSEQHENIDEDKKTICGMCKQNVSVKRNSFGKKVCQSCYIGSRFVYNNPEVAMQLLKDHPTNIYAVNEGNFNLDKKENKEGCDYQEENKKLKKIIDLICEKFHINIYDILFENLQKKLKN